MNTRLFFVTVLSLLILAGVGCQSLKVVSVNAPAYNCLFSSNCVITVNDTVDNFVTNVPSSSTNALGFLGGFLQSRTFAGQPATPEAGQYGYEYRLVLQHLSGAQSISISSMTLNFSPYSSFTYNGQPNNQVWVVTSGGLGSTGPTSAAQNGTQVTFNFSPPLTLQGGATQDASTYFFGLVSPTAPTAGANAWANFTGMEVEPGGTTIPFNFLMLRVRTP